MNYLKFKSYLKILKKRQFIKTFECETYFLNDIQNARTTERNRNYDMTPNSDSIGKTYQTERGRRASCVRVLESLSV